MKRYFTVQYKQITEDWNTDEVYFTSLESMKRCDQKDFGFDAPEKWESEYYSTWYSDTYTYNVFCADLENSDLKLYNTKGGMLTKKIEFIMQKCVNPVGVEDYCATDIEAKLKDLSI